MNQFNSESSQIKVIFWNLVDAGNAKELDWHHFYTMKNMFYHPEKHINIYVCENNKVSNKIYLFERFKKWIKMNIKYRHIDITNTKLRSQEAA